MLSVSDATPATVEAEKTSVENLVVVGLGGNIGEVVTAFRQAIGDLKHSYVLTGISHLYRSAPIGPSQPDFYNAALALEQGEDLHELLAELQQLERKAGRVRGQRWGPRTLDLDILWAGERVVGTSSLTVPHFELHRRAFAILPLLDLVPHAVDPIRRTRYSGLIDPKSSSGVSIYSATAWWQDAH